MLGFSFRKKNLKKISGRGDGGASGGGGGVGGGGGAEWEPGRCPRGGFTGSGRRRRRRGAAAPDHVALRGRPGGLRLGLAAVRALQPGRAGGVGARLQGRHLAPLARIRLRQLQQPLGWYGCDLLVGAFLSILLIHQGGWIRRHVGVVG